MPFDSYRWLSPDAPISEPTAGEWLHHLKDLASRFSVALTGYDGDALLLAAVRKHWRHRFNHGGFGAMASDVAWYMAHQQGLPPVGLRTAIARFPRGSNRAPPLPSWFREDFSRRVGLAERWASTYAHSDSAHPREPAWRNFNQPAWGWLFDEYDAGTARCPLEVRHPFTDLRLVTFALGAAAISLISRLLRRCLGDMPQAVRLRPKTPLRASPNRALIRRHGLGWAESRWEVPTLSAYVRLDELRSALNLDLPRSPEFYFCLQSVTLGL